MDKQSLGTNSCLVPDKGDKMETRGQRSQVTKLATDRMNLPDLLQQRGVELTPERIQALKVAASLEEGRGGSLTSQEPDSTATIHTSMETETWTENETINSVPRLATRPTTLIGTPRLQAPQPLVPRPTAPGTQLYVPACPRRVVHLSNEAAELGRYLRVSSNLRNKLDYEID